MPDLFAHAASQEAEGRRRQMLRTAFGPAIAAALADPTVIEVMANPDGKLWIELVPAGRRDSGERIGAAEAERIIRLVAAHVRREVTDRAPIVSAELPETGERFEGVMPPVATAPCFSIRKPAQVLYRLSDYVAARIMTPPQAQLLREAVTDKRNIVVVGGTSSGKTTLVNALLAEVARWASASSSWRTRASCSAPRRTWWRSAPSPALPRSPTSCARRSGCAPTASSSARSGARRPSTCSRLGTPAIPAASPPCTPTPAAAPCSGWSSWSRRRSSPCRGR